MARFGLFSTHTSEPKTVGATYWTDFATNDLTAKDL